jgi:hypothetical protein
MDTREKRLFEKLAELHTGLASSAPVDVSETPGGKRRRIAMLEADVEAWFKYYFTNYATAEPAPFHIAATRRVLNNPEWYEVRNWSRELAKSTRTMMEIFYLALAGARIRNVLLVSNSKDNADRLLLPYMVNFKKNNRIINDYGKQHNLGNWAAGEFITKSGVAFRALGAGQSPRGTRNEADRPDVILVDDIDTDEDCRNPDIIDKRWQWVQEALIPTRSISHPLLVIFCGNVIAEDCCVLRAREFADVVDVVNIRDEQGKSTWPQKNSEADIDRVLHAISYASQQKEYFNNPLSVGKTFAEITWGKCPPLHELPFVVVYADPAPSNKDRPGAKSAQGNSRKAVFVVGGLGSKYYIYTGYLDVMGSDTFINSLYGCRDYINKQCALEVADGRAPATYFYIENNSLQDPFYDQVYRPMILAKGQQYGSVLGVRPDTRKKPEKWFRIEALLQPLNAFGNLVFNIDENDNPHMKRLEAQFKTAKPTSRDLDGPDCIEGAIFIIKEKAAESLPASVKGARRNASVKGY